MKQSILFVDDEPSILRSLKRSLFKKRSEWNMHFSESAANALEILAENDVDLIITDMRMPVMGGVELLKKVREQYPTVIRIVFSGQSEKNDMLNSVSLSHQFLAKPCDSKDIKNAIESSLNLRKYFIKEKTHCVVIFLSSSQINLLQVS